MTGYFGIGNSLEGAMKDRCSAVQHCILHRDEGDPISRCAKFSGVAGRELRLGGSASLPRNIDRRAPKAPPAPSDAGASAVRDHGR